MDAVSDFIQRVPQAVQWGFAGVGALFLGSKIFSYLRLLLNVFVLSGTNLRKYGKPGTWAVITGASDGLGKEYANQLAKKGFNLVLVSRTASKLESLAKEIEEKNTGKGLQVKTLAMDFSENDDADYDRLKELISGLDVGILINNVGQSHSIPVPFLETSTDELENIIVINCIGTLKVTQAVVPIMKQRKPRSLVLTMGSTAGWTPTPFLATYSGSKAFLQQWNSALASELSGDNIDIYLVISHLVTTAMSKVRRPSLLIPAVRPFVSSALNKIGLGGYQTWPNTYTPWWTHSFLLWIVESIPGAQGPLTIWVNKGMHIDIRKRALRKAARDAKKQ